MGFFDKDTLIGTSGVEYLELGTRGPLVELFVTSSTTNYPMRIIGTPGENGMVKFDNRVLDPVRVHVEGWITRENYSRIEDIVTTQLQYDTKKALCKYYSKDGSEEDRLAISNIVVRSTNERLNMLFVSLDLQEYQQSI